MENKFHCPPAFDVNTARVYIISPKFKDEVVQTPYISVMNLFGARRPAYLSALGKVWKEIPLPSDILFEEVLHNCDGGGNLLKHFHTEFNLEGSAIHIDYVEAWSYGPGTGQRNVKIYADGELRASAILGGGYLGGNWQRRWPATVVVEGLLLRCAKHPQYPKGRLLFNPGDDDSPVVLYEPVSPEKTPFRVFDLTSEVFIDQRLLPSISTKEVDHLFYKGASEEGKRHFFSKLLRRGRGHFISNESLREMVSGEIFSNCLGFLREECVFKEKGGSIDSADFELNEYRTRELTSYCRRLLQALTPSGPPVADADGLTIVPI